MMNESSHFNHHPQELTKLRKDVISRDDVNITIQHQFSLPEIGIILISKSLALMTLRAISNP